ncbi:helix-turn-helix transcriptional regulator [Paenibacillus sp. Soil766]|uniref:helix-turn-helix transcriptional regulator n=1 Tax=Paenibacillus sp. Soil766 TaxID=1736404 RepID=UPI0009EC10EE|nr:WYL domain-containing protein [Paenibacillus sp. Soil766]
MKIDRLLAITVLLLNRGRVSSKELDDRMFGTLLDKVKALLSRGDRLQMEQQGAEIVFDFNPWGQGPAARDKVNSLRQAIVHTSKVRFKYLNMNGTESERVVEPAALILKGYLWYLQAYCTLRSEFRVFRLSRIQELRVLEQSFVRKQAPSLDGYAWESDWSKANWHEMTFLFHSKVQHRVGDTFDPELVTRQEDGSLQVKGPFTEDEWLYGMW